jgi:hypothetical protein
MTMAPRLWPLGIAARLSKQVATLAVCEILDAEHVHIVCQHIQDVSATDDPLHAAGGQILPCEVISAKAESIDSHRSHHLPHRIQRVGL